MRKFILALTLMVAAAGVAHAQVGPLLYEDNFNTLDHWLKVTGNGSWGWGNGELEFYRNENVDIADVPGEPGNKALRIIAKHESGPGLVDQWGVPTQYTSGKVVSKSFVSVKYGMIETRVQVPDLNNGGWPAFWMLGTATSPWPNCGEVDFMEMGAGKAFRDLHDSHNGGDGLHHSTVNQMVGANAIWNSNGAVGLANDPGDTFDRPYYNMAQPINARFLIYRVYWDDQSMRFTVTDNGVERDLYTHTFAFTPDAKLSFQQPMYLLANMAIGGAYTDCYRLGDPTSGLPISMALPATMYVDYVRVYQWNGKGEVTLGPPTPAAGRVGLYTDNTSVTSNIAPGVDSDVYVWESTLIPGTIAPFEGANVLSWKTNAKGWFGAGIMSRQPTNFFNLGDGNLKFRIKIPANVTFKIGIIDAWGNQNYVAFPANVTTYGLVRNGNWGQATLPVSVIRGTAMDLRMLSYTFVILEESGANCEFALDDIYWEGANATAVSPGNNARVNLLMPSAPNPFRSSTELRFELAAPAAYEMGIYDAAGKRVAGFRGTGHAGMNSVHWDGHDAAGNPAQPGVYWYKLASGTTSATRNVVLLR
jgi:beta-glucanase (GH16 family)